MLGVSARELHWDMLGAKPVIRMRRRMHQRIDRQRHQSRPYSLRGKNQIKALGQKFSREWVRSVGNEASIIFVPFITPNNLS